MRAQLIELTPERCELVAQSEIVEQRLDDRLAIVERALDRHRMHVGPLDRRHLPPLDVGNAAMGKEDEDVGLRLTAERLDRRRAGVARGRAEDRRPRSPPLQRAVHQPPQPLHGEILEGEGRPVEQFEHEEIVADLGQRRGRRVAESGIGVLSQRQQLGLREILADIRRDDTGRGFGVGQAGERADRLGRDHRRPLGRIEAAIASEPGQHRIAEAEPRRFAARGKITHVSWIPSGQRLRRLTHLAPKVQRTCGQ